MSIDSDASFLRVVHARQQLDDGALAGSRRSHEGHCFPKVRLDVDVVQNL